LGLCWKLLASPRQRAEKKGSFDCMIARFADDHFAQDDKRICAAEAVSFPFSSAKDFSSGCGRGGGGSR
jgi:hypothetical protein